MEKQISKVSKFFSEIQTKFNPEDTGVADFL